MEFKILYLIQDMHTPYLDSLMMSLTRMGVDSAIWMAMAIPMLFFKKTRKCGILMFVVMLLGAIVTDDIIKPLVMRERPCMIDRTVRMLVARPRTYSFPSGHALQSFACATMIFLHSKGGGIAALILAFGIAFSRMYLFVHFPTDVLAGAVIGALISAGVFYLCRAVSGFYTERIHKERISKR